jgi:hypothetical protein
MSSKYAILMETSEEEHESWYYFIKQNGNEEALKILSDQLDLIEDPGMNEDINIFDIDIINLVSETCASEMTMVELNSVSYHRKFDGILDKIDFGFKDKDKDIQRMCKVFDMIGNGEIDQFVTDEFVPDEHMRTGDSDSSDDDYSDDEKDTGDIDASKLPKSLRDFKI